MKRILIIILILAASLIIGVLAILTAIKLTSEKPLTPNAPEVKPRAQVNPSPTLTPQCVVTFAINTPTPGPSSTPTPTLTVTPTPSQGPTPTPTPKENIPPTCTSLSASPTSGDAPLVVTFVASGFDDSDGYLTGFEFNFGDGEIKKIEQTFKTTDTYTINHTYSKVGTYNISLRVKDNNNVWSDSPASCRQSVTVNGKGPTVTPIPTEVSPSTFLLPSPTEVVVVPKIPQAGNAIPALITILGGAILVVLGWGSL